MHYVGRSASVLNPLWTQNNHNNDHDNILVGILSMGVYAANMRISLPWKLQRFGVPEQGAQRPQDFGSAGL